MLTDLLVFLKNTVEEMYLISNIGLYRQGNDSLINLYGCLYRTLQTLSHIPTHFAEKERYLITELDRSYFSLRLF